MLEDAITKALASLPEGQESARLCAILARATEQLAGGRTDDPRPIRQQIREAADLMIHIYGSQALNRAGRVAATPGSTLFSRLVLAELREREE